MGENGTMNRREFLRLLAAAGGGFLLGYWSRGLLGGGEATPAPTPTFTATTMPSPTLGPTATLPPTATSANVPATSPPPPTQPPPPTPTPRPWVYPVGPSKLGIHTIEPDGTFPFVRDLVGQGGHIAIVKGVGNFGVLREVKTLSPSTITVGRWPGVESVAVNGDPRAAAEAVMNAHMPHWRGEADVVDYWEVLNEVNPGTTGGHLWLAQFYWRAMEIAEANGFRLALFSYSTGVPEWGDWAAIVETGFFARARQGGHVLALHEYNWPHVETGWGVSIPGQPHPDPERGILMGRYRHLYRDFLIPRGEVIPLVITECGLDPALSGSLPSNDWWRYNLIQEMAWYDVRLVEDDYVLGAALFTLGGGERWRIYDYTDKLPTLADYILRTEGLR